MILRYHSPIPFIILTFNLLRLIIPKVIILFFTRWTEHLQVLQCPIIHHLLRIPIPMIHLTLIDLWLEVVIFIFVVHHDYWGWDEVWVVPQVLGFLVLEIYLVVGRVKQLLGLVVHGHFYRVIGLIVILKWVCVVLDGVVDRMMLLSIEPIARELLISLIYNIIHSLRAPSHRLSNVYIALCQDVLFLLVVHVRQHSLVVACSLQWVHKLLLLLSLLLLLVLLVLLFLQRSCRFLLHLLYDT